ncbi:MAG: carboxypeptidase-like regulatory domain-containing protein, partial [bacterium]
MRLKDNLRFILLTALILTDALVAQNSTVSMMSIAESSNQISGQVVDQTTGKPLVGVNIIVQGTSFGAATDSDGRFTIQKIPPGIYTIVASMIGYHQETRDGITVTAEHPAHVKF